jgi:hypothetical protein
MTPARDATRHALEQLVARLPGIPSPTFTTRVVTELCSSGERHAAALVASTPALLTAVGQRLRSCGDPVNVDTIF